MADPDAAPSAAAAAAPAEGSPAAGTAPTSGPLVVLVVGMAGTGKTTLVQRLNHHSLEHDLRSYYVNLDPAVADVPFAANIDIRDTVNYKGIMSQYRLGPNGAIMTALNLFAAKVNQCVELIEKKRASLDYVFVDTPGQIEVFTWSASGQLITEAFAATFPTCVLFVGDTARCVSPQTFMSTMLYSSSIMYKAQLPLMIALNKADVVGGDNVARWMRDPDALTAALRGQKGYVATLTESLGVFLHDYYENTRYAVVSAMAGTGMDDLFAGLGKCRDEYRDEYAPAMEARAKALAAATDRQVAGQLARLKADLKDDDDDQ